MRKHLTALKGFAKQSKVFLFLSTLFVPVLGHAQTIENIINHSIAFLQGGIARSVGILCIIIAGYLCLYRQKFPKEYFIMILLGLGIIFGASTLYATFVS